MPSAVLFTTLAPPPQLEVCSLKAEAERLKRSAAEGDARATALLAEADAAKQVRGSCRCMRAPQHVQGSGAMHVTHAAATTAVCTLSLQAATAALKGLEARHAAEKAAAEQRAAAERTRAAAAARVAEQLAVQLRARCVSLQAALEAMAAEAGALKAGARHPVPATFTDLGGSSGSSQELSLCDAGAGGGAGPAGVRWLHLHQPAGPWVCARQALQDAASASVAAPGSRPASAAAGAAVPAAELAPLPVGLPGLSSFTRDSLAVLVGALLLDKVAADSHSDAAAAGAGLVPGDGADGGRAVALVSCWWSARWRRDLEGTVHDFFLSRCGMGGGAEVVMVVVVPWWFCSSSSMQGCGTMPPRAAC